MGFDFGLLGGPNGGLILIISGAQGAGGAKLGNYLEKSQNALTN